MKRVDILLRELGLADSRMKAQEMIEQGWVNYQGKTVTKPSQLVEAEGLEVLELLPYVGRGAYKLAAALREFSLEVADRIAMDIGASTGGFTQVLLEAGASKVYAVDVGRDQLAPLLRADPRVVSLEETDFRDLSPEDTGLIDLVVIDVSFISVTKILAALDQFLTSASDVLFLLKPQFESEGRKVKEAKDHRKIINQTLSFLDGQGYEVKGAMVSPIQGKSGNIEYLFYVRQVEGLVENQPQEALVKEAFKRFKG